jgi:DNA-binding Xre family transcriptional regulator
MKSPGPRRPGQAPARTGSRRTVIRKRGTAGTPEPDRFWLTVVDSRRLRQLRLERQFTQLDLADYSGISISTISKLESKRGSRCRDSTVAALADALGAPAESLRDVTDPAFAGFKLLTPRASKNGNGGK